MFTGERSSCVKTGILTYETESCRRILQNKDEIRANVNVFHITFDDHDLHIFNKTNATWNNKTKSTDKVTIYVVLHECKKTIFSF